MVDHPPPLGDVKKTTCMVCLAGLYDGQMEWAMVILCCFAV